MTLQIHSAATVDLPQLAAGSPPIIDVAHTAHASTTLLYVVLSACTGADATVAPTAISATWAGAALTQHLSNFSASINRAVAWSGWLRTPATGAKMLRLTFDKVGKGFACTFYDISGAVASGSPFGAGSSQFRDETVRTANTASSLSITPDAAGTSLVIACLNLNGNGTMSYSAPGFTAVSTGQFGEISGNSSGKSQQTHRYLLNASGTITVSQTCTNADRRHGILLVEILPAATSLDASVDGAVGIDVGFGRQVAAGRGLSEAALVDVGQSGAIRGTGSPERPAATWVGAAQVYDPATAREIKAGRALTVTGVGPTTLSDGRPAGSFPHNATSLVEAAPSNLGLNAVTIEGWTEATTRGTIICIGTPGTSTAGLRLRSTNLNGTIANCYLLSRTTSSGTQFSTSAADTAVLNAPQHLASVWPANGNPGLYINGEFAALEHSGAVSSGPIVIGSSDQVRIGDPGVSGLTGMVGKIARINIWPTAWSATRAKIAYRQQSDAVGNAGLGGENLLADVNKSPVAVPFRAAATAGQALTLDPRTFGYDPNGDTMSLSGTPTAPAGHGITVSAGNIVYTPPPSFSGETTLNFALRDPGGKVSPAIIRVTVTAPVVTPPPQTGSILPALYQYNGTVRQANTGNAQSVINGAANGDIVVLAAGTYPGLTIPANKSIWLRGAVVPWTSMDCAPVFSTDDEMTAADDHSPRDRRVTGLRAPSELARFTNRLVIASPAANVRVSNVLMDCNTNYGLVVDDQFQRICVDHVWCTSCDSRNIGIGSGTPTNYKRSNGEYVEFQTIIYNDTRKNPEGGFSDAGEWTDYGTIVHGTRNVYVEDRICYGGFNHGFSLKGYAGTVQALFNRCVFASRNQQNSGGNTNQLQIGQNIDDYQGSVGDITCGPVKVTNSTFIGFNRPSTFQLSAISYQNAASLEVSGSVFGRFWGSDRDERRNFIRMTAGDSFSTTPSPRVSHGLKAWRGDLYVHDCDIRTSRTFAPASASADYENCRLRFERNTTPGNGILIVPNGHPVTLGANSGFRTS